MRERKPEKSQNPADPPERFPAPANQQRPKLSIDSTHRINNSSIRHFLRSTQRANSEQKSQIWLQATVRHKTSDSLA
jgi:hypothetical protein